MKRVFLIFLALLCLFPLSSCQEEKAQPRLQVGGIETEGETSYPTNFLFFNGKEIGFDEFRYYYLNLKDQYQKENANYFNSEEAEKALTEEALSVLKTAWGARILAEENNVNLSGKEKRSVKKDISKTIETYDGKENFQKELEKSYMTMDLYQYMMEYSALYLKLFHTLYEEGGKFAWSEEEFYQYYKENYLSVQQIFIPYHSGENKENHPGTQKEIEKIYKEAQNGKDFWSLVKKYGKDKNMLDFPDGYYFTKGQAEDVLYESAKNLKEEEISSPVAGETGVYLIKRMKLKKMRMDENKKTALFGYTDSYGQFHAGAYDEDFQKKFQETADKIKVEKSGDFDLISTKTVH